MSEAQGTNWCCYKHHTGIYNINSPARLQTRSLQRDVLQFLSLLISFPLGIVLTLHTSKLVHLLVIR